MSDFLPIQAIDHLEFYVGNAKQAAYYYEKAFGFRVVGYAGLETGVRDRASYLLEQGEVRLVLTSALSDEHPIAEHVKRHGDGVKTIALRVSNAQSAFEETVKRGAAPVLAPTEASDENGTLRLAAIATYGETIHTFVDRTDYQGVFAPGYRAVHRGEGKGLGIAAIDHIVGNVELNKMLEWVQFYEQVMGFSLFQTFEDKDISTEYSALMSKVMAGGKGKVKFPINEPAEGRKRSQIQEYLDYYKSPGVQHIALITGDIVATVDQLKRNGVEFMRVPDAYYDTLVERVGHLKENIEDLRRLNILVDQDEEGYLLQIFTRPVQDRPTVFYEIIQRRGSRGFGKGNFKALFEAIEREQEERGNL